MTLVVTVNGPESLWLLVDRRLSYKTRPPKDDARKFVFLETTDGVAFLAYAGLGATARGTEPADWMTAVLGGRNLPLEQALALLADAMRRELPPHMLKIPGDGGPVHSIFAPAFVDEDPRLYTIDLAFAPNRKSYQFRYTQHVNDLKLFKTPRVAVGGSGQAYLFREKKKWLRPLLRMVRAHDRGQLSALAVADHLAKLNNEVHLGTPDQSVGPRCIVAWRHRKEGVHQGGGSHQFYTGATRDVSSLALPTVVQGMDLEAIIASIMPRVTAEVPATEWNKDPIDAEVARFLEKRDKTLR
jgi:hypothetical protein